MAVRQGEAASGRRQASSVGNIGTRRAVHALVVWAAMLSIRGIGTAPISGLGGGLGEGPTMRAPFPWNINTSGPVQPNHTAKAGSAPNPPARPCRRSAGAGRGVRALPAARIIKAMGASSFFSSLLGVAPIFSPSPMVITGITFSI